MKLNISNLLKKLNEDINFITIDGITCSGKTLFAKLLKKKLNNATLISKDIFLIPRSKRIKITKKIKKNLIYNQNLLHYDIKKINLLIKFLINGNKKKKLLLKQLYNRKNGKNNLTQTFYFKPKKTVIFEGIYTAEDMKKIIKPSLKILIIENVYKSLFRKIERIRDKKISIQNVVTEFSKLHLSSYLKYLKQNSFNLIFSDLNQNFIISKNGKKKQILEIKNFLKKHTN